MPAADESRGAELAELTRLLVLWLQNNLLPQLPGPYAVSADSTVFVAGVYRNLDAGGFSPGKLSEYYGDEVEERHLRVRGHGARHVLLTGDPSVLDLNGLFENRIVQVGADLSQKGALEVFEPWLDSAEPTREELQTQNYFTFAGLAGRTDLVWDDADEAKRRGFSSRYQSIFDYQIPRPAYAQNVNEILPIHERVNPRDFRKYLYWNATYANRKRVSEKGGDHYDKWLKNPRDPRRDNSYKPSNLSNEYLEETFYEYVLQKDKQYLLLELAQHLLLYQLELGPARFPSLDASIVPKLVWRQVRAKRAPSDQAPAKPQGPFYAIVFHALEGRKTPAPLQASRGVMELTGNDIVRFVYDYKAAVRKAYADTHARLDLSDDEAAFRMFVDVRFPDSIYALDGSLEHADVSSFTLPELLAQAGEAAGPALPKLREIATAKPDARFVVQGWYYGGSERTRAQLIGIESEKVYEFRPETGVVTRMSVSAWLEENYLHRLSNEVYESTKGMLPFIKAVTYLSMVAMTGGMVGGAALAQAARVVVLDYARKIGTKQATKQIIKHFRAQLVALVADGILGFLPPTRDLAFELVRGFAHGFGAGAISHWMETVDERFEKQVRSLYKTALNKATKGAYRAYQTYLKLSAAYHKLSGVYSAVSKVWNDTMAQRFARRLADVCLALGIGFTLLLMVILYFDYVYRSGKKSKAERDKRALEVCKLAQLMIKETGADVAAYAESLRSQGSTPSAKLVRERTDRMSKALVAGAVKVADDPSFAAILSEILQELGIDNWKELQELGVSGLLARGWESFLENHPNLAAQEARALGEALGELIGTVCLQRKLMPKKWLDSLDKSPVFKKAVTKTVSERKLASVLHFAAFPLDELRKVANSAAQQIAAGASTPASGPDATTRGVFESINRPDSAYRSVIRELSHMTQDLTKSLTALASDATLSTRLAQIAASAESGPPPAPEALEGATDDPLWPRDALRFTLETWLHAGAYQILSGFNLIEDETLFDGHFRIAQIFESLGLDVALDDKLVVGLRTQFEI